MSDSIGDRLEAAMLAGGEATDAPPAEKPAAPAQSVEQQLIEALRGLAEQEANAPHYDFAGEVF